MKAKLRILVTAILAVAGVSVGGAHDKIISIGQIKGTAVEDAVSSENNRPGGPSINTDGTVTATFPTDDQMKKIFFLYNVQLSRVLFSGQTYGTEAILSNVGHYVWVENANANTGGTYNIHSSLNTLNDATGYNNGYLRLNDNAQEPASSRNGNTNNIRMVYLDHNKTETHSGWSFEKVDNADTGVSDDNVYVIYTTDTDGTRYYLSANATQLDDGNYWIGISTRRTSETFDTSSKLAQWKLISLYDYLQMFNNSAADMTSPLDASFLLLDPGFHVNNRYLVGWDVTGNDFRFGVENVYKTVTGNYGMSGNTYYNYQGEVQRIYGEDYFAFTHSAASQNIHQDVQVIRPGWYIVRCKGFSTLNYKEDGSTGNTVTLYAQQVGDDANKASQSLNGISESAANEALAAPDGTGNNYRGARIGQDFMDGRYVNQVMIKIPSASETQKATIRLGININGTSAAKSVVRRAESTSNPYTAFDNFQLLYAGNTTTPDLVLNEEDENGLDTLVNTSDSYRNVTLHMKRTFTFGKWNTIVLPVNLNAGQIRTAFGDGVQLAYLKNLTATSMQFERVTIGTDDNAEALVAYQPYIIKPTKGPGDTPAYTTSALSSTDAKYSGKTLSVAANHYDISMVSLDNDALGRIGTSTSSSDLKVNHDTWETVWSGAGHQSTTYDNRYINAIGTMSKTWTTHDASGNATTPTPKDGRGGLGGDYYMSGGEMWRVPTGKVYPLKAFRVWFRPVTVSSGAAKLSVWLDDEELMVHDNGTATGIDGITFSETKGVTADGEAAADGVYTVTGQRVRSGLSTEGLPEGLYIVAGKKVMVK